MSRQKKRHRGKRGKAPRPKPTIGLAIIARDEETTLPTLLASATGAFDEVALLDTGSTDETVAVFEEWCRRTGQRHHIAYFDWVYNFALARNTAQELLTTDWVSYADADDTIVGARHLRRVAASAEPDVVAYDFDYDYMTTSDGRVLCFPRERLVRRGRGFWIGRIHEQQVVLGPTVSVPRAVAYWKHAPKTIEEFEADEERDNRIFEQWAAEEPDNPWVEVWRGLTRAEDASDFVASHRALAALAGERVLLERPD